MGGMQKENMGDQVVEGFSVSVSVCCVSSERNQVERVDSE
jgi:hypothetical protein